MEMVRTTAFFFFCFTIIHYVKYNNVLFKFLLIMNFFINLYYGFMGHLITNFRRFFSTVRFWYHEGRSLRFQDAIRRFSAV